VINLVCGIGEDRRRREVEAACARAGFELVLFDGSLGELAAPLERLLAEERVDLLVAPSPHDGHPAHERVGAAAIDALESLPSPAQRLWLWGLWADLPWPTLYSGFDDSRLERVLEILGAHEGELERNDYRTLVRGRAEANRCLGSERVFGFGAPMRPEPYAELLMEVERRDDGWWTGGARELAPADPLRAPPPEGLDRERPIGWWLHAPSFAQVMADTDAGLSPPSHSRYGGSRTGRGAVW
jgi:hypothetical protein